METTKYIDTALAGTALTVAAANTVYVYRKVQEFNLQNEAQNQTLTAISTQVATHGSNFQQVGSRFDNIAMALKALKTSHANMGGSLDDLVMEFEDLRAGLQDWASAITAVVKNVHPDVDVPELIVGQPPQPPARQRRAAGQRAVGFQGRAAQAAPRPARRRQVEEDDEQTQDDQDDLAIFRSKRAK